MSKTIKRTAVVGLTLGASLTVGVAFAVWTSTGSGDGSAASDANQALTFSSAAVVDNLYPTGDGSIEFEAANPNHYDVRLSAITVSSVYDVDDVDNVNPVDDKTNLMTTCDIDYVAPTSYTGPNFLILGDAEDQVVHLPGALTMGNDSDGSCANKTFGVVLNATTASE